ncbi:MAG TPA: aminotransferase class III-fold pyridoxal phosphate-dependent enzyme [Gemmatimonadales bacterium]|nr:aminotransferase class III-fold pyridoxal phosphate-dependent enzyme [Gemmatimonadales bacterium]
MTWPVAGFTSTGSKRPEALFGGRAAGVPVAMVRSAGCRVWDADGHEYLDLVMALGAVALGYGHPAVTEAVVRAVRDGGVGPLPPVLEEEVASELVRRIPWIEQVRFLKTGAEAMAAAVRLARTATGREAVLGCGYHGWLDWCQMGEGRGVPSGTRALYAELPFNDPERAREQIRRAGDTLAAVVFEPVILGPPDPDWLAALREETTRAGAVLIADEIKTIGRLAPGGGAERFGFRPDLVVMAKAIANGFPLAAVGGRADLMQAADRTWISSTLATEWVALAAARATLAVLHAERVPGHLARVGERLMNGFRALAGRHPTVVRKVAGLPEMCCLEFHDEAVGAALAVASARRGLLFKRSAYNFVSLAHDDASVDQALALLAEACDEIGETVPREPGSARR